jgi:hypothetical protein
MGESGTASKMRQIMEAMSDLEAPRVVTRFFGVMDEDSSELEMTSYRLHLMSRVDQSINQSINQPDSRPGYMVQRRYQKTYSFSSYESSACICVSSSSPLASPSVSSSSSVAELSMTLSDSRK